MNDALKLWRNGLRHTSVAPLITFAVFLVAGIITTATAWQNYRTATIGSEIQAQAAAHVVAAHAEWMMEASVQALQRIDDALASQSIRSGQGDVRDIAKAVGQLPVGFQYSVYDQDGMLRYSSYPQAVVISVSDREYFQQLKAGALTSISPQLDERLSHLQVFVIGRRIATEGTFRGVATIAIPVSKMDEFWGTMALGPGSTVSIVRDDGWLLARYPGTRQSVDFRSTPLIAQYKKGLQQGVYHSDGSPADGISRIIGFWKVSGWPILAVAGIESGHALDSFYAALVLQLALSVPLTLLLLVGTYLMVRLLQAFERRNADLETAVERNTFLFKEIHHRVKNNLQAVSSLIRLQPVGREIKADVDRRISAMVALQEQIYQNDQFDRVDIGAYTSKLVGDLAQSYGTPVEIEMNLASVQVDRDQALPLGMIINEVVSNAFKYAFTDQEAPRLEITIAEADHLLTLEIRDNGPGYDTHVTPGTGSRLIKAFVSQLLAKTTISNESGMVFRLECPLNAKEQVELSRSGRKQRR